MTRQEEFRSKFFALLREYNVEMEVVIGGGWEAGPRAITFYAPGADDEVIDFETPCWINGDNNNWK
jgi:hypothetical protein